MSFRSASRTDKLVVRHNLTSVRRIFFFVCGNPKKKNIIPVIFILGGYNLNIFHPSV